MVLPPEFVFFKMNKHLLFFYCDRAENNENICIVFLYSSNCRKNFRDQLVFIHSDQANASLQSKFPVLP